MAMFEKIEEYGHEELIFCSNRQVGLKAIIAIHDTTLGPALGGCRMLNYKTEEEAVDDVLKLASSMTYKAAVSGLNLGGGKMVIIGDPYKDKSEGLFRALGQYIESLNGRYITAEDVGTTVDDMELISLETRFVTGISTVKGGSGDPSLVTAYGIYVGIKACLKEIFGDDSVKDRTIAIQGVGHVGYHLAGYIYKDRGKIICSDIDKENVKRAEKEFKAFAVSPDKIYSVKCDVLSPCALGGIINDKTLPLLKCRIVAGSANNQLKEPYHGNILTKKGILYAPDFVINAGGLINVADELEGYNRDRALKSASKIFKAIEKVIAISKRDNIATHLAADKLAEERIQNLRTIRPIYSGQNKRR